MFDPILVPLDGSQLAECVLPHVVAIARSFDAENHPAAHAGKEPCRTDPHNYLIYLTGKSIKQGDPLSGKDQRHGFQEAGLQVRDERAGRVGGGRDHGICPKSGNEINHFEQSWTQWLDSMGDQQHYAKNHSERANLAAHRSGASIWGPLW